MNRSRLAAAAIAAFVLIGVLIAYSLQTVPAPITTTITSTVTSTAVPTQQAEAQVGDSFDQHLLVFSSRNVSAIISQYQLNANVTWNGLFCWSGFYPNAGSSGGDLAKLLNIFFAETKDGFSVGNLHSVFVGNVTRPSMTDMANGSVAVNSTFGLVGEAPEGNFTATVSAHDLYSYSTTSNTWLISGEVWHFLNYYLPPTTLISSIPGV